MPEAIELVPIGRQLEHQIEQEAGDVGPIAAPLGDAAPVLQDLAETDSCFTLATVWKGIDGLATVSSLVVNIVSLKEMFDTKSETEKVEQQLVKIQKTLNKIKAELEQGFSAIARQLKQVETEVKLNTEWMKFEHYINFITSSYESFKAGRVTDINSIDLETTLKDLISLLIGSALDENFDQVMPKPEESLIFILSQNYVNEACTQANNASALAKGVNNISVLIARVFDIYQKGGYALQACYAQDKDQAKQIPTLIANMQKVYGFTTDLAKSTVPHWLIGCFPAGLVPHNAADRTFRYQTIRSADVCAATFDWLGIEAYWDVNHQENGAQVPMEVAWDISAGNIDLKQNNSSILQDNRPISISQITFKCNDLASQGDVKIACQSTPIYKFFAT